MKVSTASDKTPTPEVLRTSAATRDRRNGRLPGDVFYWCERGFGYRRSGEWATRLNPGASTGSSAVLADPFALPDGHDLNGFPPVLMVNADRDIMRASGDQFAAELVSADGDVERHVLPETQHAFLNRPHLAAFTTAIDLIASWSLH